MNQPLDHAKTIFLRALESHSPEQWEPYLDGACDGDSSLRARVAELLAAHRELGSFLDDAASRTNTIEMPAAWEQPGAQIGPYKLLQQIGEGGMGVVYMAEQAAPVRRKVALKIVKPGMDTREVIARFEAERQALALMDHPNIARVFDGGATQAGRPYFVMELVRGIPITDYCDKNNLAIHERLELFVTVCHAVQHAHQKGIIHRDLKPSNILVTLFDGRPVPKVIDFGVAKAIGPQLIEKTLFTQFAQMVGTPLYMSPEQAELTGLDVDTRGDIYSLGVLLYELLTGTTPFESVRMKRAAVDEIRRMIRDEDPPSPSTRLSSTAGETQTAVAAHRRNDPKGLNRLVRGDLDWIVMKAIEKDRTRRYETANGFAADVVRYLSNEAVQARPPSAAYLLRKFGRRHRAAIATAAALSIALVLGTAVSIWQAIRATRAEGLARTRLAAETDAKNATREQLRLTAQAQEEATRRLYEARLAQAKARSMSRRMGQRFEGLDAVAKATEIARELKLDEEHFLELRNAAIACLALTDLQVAQEWPGWPTGSVTLNFDGGLQRYARADRQGVVSVRRVADDVQIYRLAGMGPGENWPYFSPDGQCLALWRGLVPPAQFQLWNLTGQAPIMLLEEPTDSFAFSADSRQFARALPDGSVRLYDLPSGREIERLQAGPRARGLAFHPKKNQLALSCATGVQIRDLETGGVVELPQAGAGQIAWRPDGTTLAVDGGDRIVYIWDVTTRQPVAQLVGHKSRGIRFAFNPAGNLLTSACWDGVLRLWDPRTGQQLFQTPTDFLSHCFSSDNQRLAAGLEGDKVRIWKVATASGYRTFVRESVADTAEYYRCAIHPGGRLLAVGMAEGADLWDLVTGKHLASIAMPTNNQVILFGHSGELLTSGIDRLRIWPVATSPNSGTVRVGPPQSLPVRATGNQISTSLDGEVLASAQFNGGLVWRRDRPDDPRTLGRHDDVRYIAVSPDGRWVATGSHSGTKVIVWDAKSGALKKVLPIEVTSRVSFSPNGKWLATTGDGLHLWAVDSWQPGPIIGGGGSEGAHAFTADGKLLAVETGLGVVRLVDPDTGREYARLADPNQDRAGAMCFSRDGAQLVTTSNDSQSIHVWDLRTIREQLAKMGLDWDLPAYDPPALEDGHALQVQVDRGDLDTMAQAQAWRQQGLGFTQARQWDQAVAAYMKAIELAPTSADVHNNLAWLLATCPDAKVRDPKRAVEVATEAVALAPNEGMFQNTLGIAEYRDGNWPAASEALNASHELLADQYFSFNAFFLAMANFQLDHKEVARQWFERAVAWMDEYQPQNEELIRFRAEAAELLEPHATPDN